MGRPLINIRSSDSLLDIVVDVAFAVFAIVGTIALLALVVYALVGAVT